MDFVLRKRLLVASLSCVAASAVGCSSTPTSTPADSPSTPAVSVPGSSMPASRPDHVVVVMEENHGYQDVITAPYIASLAAQGASFTQSFAVTHPSQPNYLALFSGDTQAVGDDSCPHTFSADNLGHQLSAAGLTFAGYSEDLPRVGFTGCSAGDYARKHAPWVNFSDVPASANKPLSAFPSDFSNLPTLSFVVPNLVDDMHSGSIAAGDSWLRQHIDPYARWATTHNSLLIVTWDEDDYSGDNQIATIVVGAEVKPGQYAQRITHYAVLRTLEVIFGLAPLGSAASAQPISGIWR
jgi:acid phosphatase